MVDSNDLAQLRAELAELRQEVSRLRDTAPAPLVSLLSDSAAVEIEDDGGHHGWVSRRRLLGLAAAGVGGVGLAASVGALPAAANDPNDLTIAGLKANGSTTATQLNTTGAVGGAQVLFQSGTTWTAGQSGFEAALAGWASSGHANTGVYGFSSVADGIGVAASSLFVGASISGNTVTLRLQAQDGTGAPRNYGYRRGDIVSQLDGVWVCIETGNPGTWRKIQGAGSAGAFHAITPTRVYDSRSVGSKQPLAGNSGRTVTVSNAIASNGGTTSTVVVPVGATAIAYNLTVVDTVGVGYLVAYPAGLPKPLASSINWFGPNQVMANALIGAISSGRQLEVYTSQKTHFIIDVSGYYL